MITLSSGNLLNADAEALVNTVNCVGVMGKGIALQFSKKFPAMLAAYKVAHKAGELQPGRIHVFEGDDMLSPRFILNFPTKRHWRGKSRMEDIESGLDALVAEIRSRDIKSVAVPPLGCGNGGLPWDEVRPLIEEKLGSLNDVNVLLFPPAGAPEAESMAHNTERPNMNPSRAITLKAWEQYFALGYQLTLLEVHKILYFLQEAGQPLRLRFQKDRYGPYADNLRHLLHRFEGHFTLGFADGKNRPETLIEIQDGAIQEADAFLLSQKDSSQDSMKRLQRVTSLIEGFESPYGMELLASVHWAAVKEGAGSLERVLEIIADWSPRKQTMMKPPHVELAWSRLSDGGWLDAS